jgi:uncharacterized iron-regulated protein
MATASNLRSRRNEAQLHALAGVEREIRANDPNGRRKYLRDFSQAFRSYESILDLQELKDAVHKADMVLLADYHALPAAQRFGASLFEGRTQPGDRPVVLGLETIFSRDQHILDEWWRREIDEAEFRQRIRFDLDWGYDWAPFYELLVTAREHGEAIYGLDCMPREDLRKIAARDRHAAHKLAEIRQQHPHAAIMVVFGESHLAPGHLPRLLHEQLPTERVLTLLQNVDALYWHAAGERQGTVDVVRVSEDVVCVFNSTPLEKYEHYRLHLSRWGRTDGEGPDLAPTIYNLIDSLLRFLDINRYSSRNGIQPRFLVDLMPEVYGRASEGHLCRMLLRRGLKEADLDVLLQRVEERGCAYLAQANAFYVREFQMMYAAEECTRFLHHACRGLPARGKDAKEVEAPDRFYSFYSKTLEHALAYFGSCVLYPARSSVQMGDENELPPEARVAAGDGLHASSELLGYMLGNAIYDAYLAGRFSRAALRRLFLAHLEPSGAARQLYRELTSRLNAGTKKPRTPTTRP